MQVGSIVTPTHNFRKLRDKYPNLKFPEIGDLLTIKLIEPHLGKQLLFFEEIDLTLVDKDENGRANFIELQGPDEVNFSSLLPP